MLLPSRLARNRFVTVVMILLGLGLAAAGGWFAYANAAFLADSQRATGTVMRLVAKRSAKGMTLYHPQVTFVTPRDGRPVTFQSRTGLWPSPFAVGEKVKVAFDPADPGTAKIVTVWTLWFLPGCMIGFGLLAVILGRSKLKQ
jgi:hypothetical protein